MQECDLVMKGGLTSGVVYPFAITELSQRFFFRNIGGTSAGAIAATLAAAAEYRRQASGGADNTGFDEIKALADELAKQLQEMFQPTANLSGAFKLLLASISPLARKRGVPLAIIAASPGVFPVQLCVFLVFALCGAVSAYLLSNIWIALAALLMGAILTISLIGWRVYSWLSKDLRDNDFGMCTGKTMRGAKADAFGDWIARAIHQVAGLTDKDPPLAIGDLKMKKLNDEGEWQKQDGSGEGIELAAMTTDLATARPYQLPLKTKIYYFSKSEMKRLLDERTLNYLCDEAWQHQSHDPEAPRDLYQLKHSDHFPVYLVARMSLSFPGLISGVPLWRYDDGVRTIEVEREVDGKPQKQKKPEMRRCLFSDGGISSNFPIHFFDALMPKRPTLGISLGEWEEARHGSKESDRIHIEERSVPSHQLPVRPVTGLLGFAGSIVNTAKDWQDTMQSLLPGYADRIVSIRLDPENEGGLNLNMKPCTITQLQDYGREAGKALCKKFDYSKGGAGFDQHRYLRAVSLLPKLEQALEGFDEALEEGPVGVKNALTGRDILTTFPTKHYACSTDWRTGPFVCFANALGMLGKHAKDNLDWNAHSDSNLPRIDASIRFVAQADRDPSGELG